MKHTPRLSLLILLLSALALALQVDTAHANNYRGKCYKNYRSSYNKNCRSSWSRSNCKSRSYNNCCKSKKTETKDEPKDQEAAELEEEISIAPIPVSLQPEAEGPDSDKKTPELKMEDSKPTEAPKPKKAD